MPLGAFRLNAISKALAAGSSFVSASGGSDIYYVIDSAVCYKVHTFASSIPATFTVSAGGNVDMLLVGGGAKGGGGVNYRTGGGGGGGRVQTLTNIPVTAGNYTITPGVAGTTAGATGNSSTALGYTSVGGGAGGTGAGGAGGAAGGGGGGANTSAGAQFVGGTGTFAGGDGRINTSTFNGGGGGGGSTSAAGTVAGGASNASDGTGGAGAAGPSVTGFDLASPKRYGGGGGGAGSVSGAAGGAGGGSDGGGGFPVAATTATGGGGGGAYNAGTIRAGGDGGSGVVKIRYPVAVTPTLTFITSATSTASTITIPTCQVGDIAILVDSTTSTTGGLPIDWTNLQSTSITGLRTLASTKIMVAGDSGSTVTGYTSGTLRKTILIYRISGATINQQLVLNINQQATTAAPTNQTKPVNQNTPLMIRMATYNATASIASRGWSVGSPTEFVNNQLYVKALMYQVSETVPSTVISMGDSGTNNLMSFDINYILN